MKVLMFGWEFPPHISGGLGTACHGLANSLGREEVEVLFVVPKLYGDESAPKTRLINASTIRIKHGNTTSTPGSEKLSGYASPYNRLTSSQKLPIHTSPESDKKITVWEKEGFTYIEVPSGLSAYRALDFTSHSIGVEHWNYILEHEQQKLIEQQTKAQAHETPSIVNHIAAKQAKPSNSSEEFSYTFSGTYGPNLLQEVEQYAKVAEQIAKDFSFDVIHAHDWMTYPAGIAAKKISGKPLVVHVHATEYDRSGEYVDARVRTIEYNGMKQADRVITVSEWTKKTTVERYHIPEEKVDVVHNGIILKDKPNVIFKSPLKKFPIVTFLGRITHQKGPLFFVEAARKVLEQIPDARFIVAGAGDLLPAMIQRTAQLKISSKFHFTGFLKGKDIDKIWSMSNVYVMPSVSEPFGIAPLEAIQAGVPVIISKQSGVSEVMPHTIAVDFWNTTALANAICGVLHYKSLHNTLKKNGEAEIKNITWEKAAKKLNDLYHDLISHA
jgi:glycogen(starch) synthase